MLRLLAYLLFVNAVSGCVMCLDKELSQMPGWQRVPESFLCILAALGGWPAGMHKTQKSSFQLLLSTLLHGLLPPTWLPAVRAQALSSSYLL
eukprot:jgi/Chlat1/4393/Chrsp29S04616